MTWWEAFKDYLGPDKYKTGQRIEIMNNKFLWVPVTYIGPGYPTHHHIVRGPDGEFLVHEDEMRHRE